jgi:hypothetical protein
MRGSGFNFLDFSSATNLLFYLKLSLWREISSFFITRDSGTSFLDLLVDFVVLSSLGSSSVFSGVCVVSLLFLGV